MDKVWYGIKDANGVWQYDPEGDGDDFATPDRAQAEWYANGEYFGEGFYVEARP